MNLLMKKNFSAEASKERSYNKLGGRHRKSAATGGVHGGRVCRESVFISEEQCCSAPTSPSYRTHIFLNAQQFQDGSSSGNNAGGGIGDQDGFFSASSSGKSQVAPLLTVNSAPRRKTSLTTWNPCDYLGNQNADILHPLGYSKTNDNASAYPGKRMESSSFTSIDKDCFIIPIARMNRFLPAGIPLPNGNDTIGSLNLLQIEDAQLCIGIHLMSHMEAVEPLLESPLSAPFAKQRQAASELLVDITSSKSHPDGMLLSSLEKDSAFPLISYYSAKCVNALEARDFFGNLRERALRKFDPQTFRYTMGHTFDLFSEVATIARPPLQSPTSGRLPAKSNSDSTGYIITIYKVFEGDDGEEFERNWLYWTGARMIYRYLPKSAGLRRITLHKSQLTGDKLYFLLVECSNFLEEFSAIAFLLPALRGRLCGYTGIYRSITSS